MSSGGRSRSTSSRAARRMYGARCGAILAVAGCETCHPWVSGITGKSRVWQQKARFTEDPGCLGKLLGSLENGLGSHYSHAGCDPELWTSSPKLSYTWQSCGPLRKRNTQANVHPNGTVHRDIVRPVKSSIVSRQPVGARNCTVGARQSLSSLPISAAHCRTMRWHAL